MARTTMLNEEEQKKRIGKLEKADKIRHLLPVEEALLELLDRYRVGVAYDVIADELPYFRTFSYTEWAGNLIVYPLCLELRTEQIRQAIQEGGDSGPSLTEFLQHQVESGQANKYKHRKKEDEPEYRPYLVVLLGSNKIKRHVCLNKLRWIVETHGDQVWFKPHPITTWAIIGEITDLFGEHRVLHRDADLYDYMVHAERVYTTHHSESAAFAVSLGLEIHPIDVYQTRMYGAFSHINTFLFNSDNPRQVLDRMFRSPKCGVFNPMIEENWQQKLREYVEWMMDVRDRFKYHYLDKPPGEKAKGIKKK